MSHYFTKLGGQEEDESAQSSNKFDYWSSWTVFTVLVFHKHNSSPLGLIQPSSPNTKELHAEPYRKLHHTFSWCFNDKKSTFFNAVHGQNLAFSGICRPDTDPVPIFAKFRNIFKVGQRNLNIDGDSSDETVSTAGWLLRLHGNLPHVCRQNFRDQWYKSIFAVIELP